MRRDVERVTSSGGAGIHPRQIVGSLALNCWLMFWALSSSMTRRILCRRRPIRERTPSALVEGLQISYSLVHLLGDKYPPPGVTSRLPLELVPSYSHNFFTHHPQWHGSPASLDNRCSLKRAPVELRFSKRFRASNSLSSQTSRPISPTLSISS